MPIAKSSGAIARSRSHLRIAGRARSRLSGGRSASYPVSMPRKRQQPLSASLDLSAKLPPRLIVGEPMTLPGIMDVDTGRTASVSAEAAVQIMAGATIRVGGEKVASDAVSQNIGITQTVAGHKVEHEAQAPPPRTAPWARGRHRRTSIEWNQWEFGTLEFGALAGAVTNTLTGDVIGYGRSAAGGAVITYVWGLWRWWDENRQR
jgi:hypothetical protein